MKKYGITYLRLAALVGAGIAMGIMLTVRPVQGQEDDATDEKTVLTTSDVVKEVPITDSDVEESANQPDYAITLKTGESCEITFDELAYQSNESGLAQVSLRMDKGVSDLKPGQFFTFEAYSNNFYETPFKVGTAPFGSSSMVSEYNGNAWQDRQGALRITVMSGTITFTRIVVTVRTGINSYSSNICKAGKKKIRKGVAVSNPKIPKELRLSPRWRGITLEFPPHCRIKNPNKGKCLCDICKRTRGILVMDQSQTVYNGGCSARALPQQSFWQSFTPSITGSLERLDIGFFGDMTGFGKLTVYSGEGVFGEKLYSETVPVVAGRGHGTWNSYFMKIPIVAEKTYTFQFAPDPMKMPDPYGLCIGAWREEGSKQTLGVGTEPLYPRGKYGSCYIEKESTHERSQSVFRTYVRPDKK